MKAKRFVLLLLLIALFAIGNISTGGRRGKRKDVKDRKQPTTVPNAKKSQENIRESRKEKHTNSRMGTSRGAGACDTCEDVDADVIDLNTINISSESEKQKELRTQLVYAQSTCELKDRIPEPVLENIVEIYCKPNAWWTTVIVKGVDFPVWSVHRLSDENLEKAVGARNMRKTRNAKEQPPLDFSLDNLLPLSQTDETEYPPSFSPSFNYDDIPLVHEAYVTSGSQEESLYKDSQKKFVNGHSSVRKANDKEYFATHCYDRAHLVPAFHFSNTKKDTYTMNNAVPQLHYINEEWGILERKMANFFKLYPMKYRDILENILVHSFVLDNVAPGGAPAHFWRVVVSERCKHAMAFHSGNDKSQPQHTAWVIKDQKGKEKIPTNFFSNDIVFFPDMTNNDRCNKMFMALLEFVERESQEDNKRKRNNNNNEERNFNKSPANQVIPLPPTDANRALLVDIANTATWIKHQQYDMYFLTGRFNGQQQNLATMHILEQVPKESKETGGRKWKDNRSIWDLRRMCFARGHLIPRADVFPDLYLMTYSKYNWAPQNSRFNSQWAKLEKDIRDNVRECNRPVKIVTGVLFLTEETEVIAGWRIPNIFYKLIIVNDQDAIFFAMRNKFHPEGRREIFPVNDYELPGVAKAGLNIVANWHEFSLACS